VKPDRPAPESDIAVHLNPVWRDRADFVIRAGIEEDGVARRFEQLWVRKLGESRFEICCIPFFVYDLALGDEVEVAPEDYLLDHIVVPSGHYTFRAWFGDSTDPGGRDEVCSAAERMGCEFEWYSENLLAVDAAGDESAQRVADYLLELESRDALVFETGRTR
jgi:hypothetical protein